jgi:hypothetical protein
MISVLTSLILLAFVWPEARKTFEVFDDLGLQAIWFTVNGSQSAFILESKD